MNALVLVNNEKNQYFPSYSANCTLKTYYKTEAFFHRVLRKIILKTQSPIISLLFSHWKQDANMSDTIIVFDTRNMIQILKWLRKTYPTKRIIAWYWNSIADSVDPAPINNIDNIEMWSFDYNDCQKYGFEFNTQFYFPENLDRVGRENFNAVDVYYVGADKNRSKTLYDLSLIFKRDSISFYYHLIQFNNCQNEYGFIYSETLLYPDVVEGIKHSKVIIDLVAEWQEGITLRPLEAIFFKKKLITNMKHIVNYDFYNRNNIFIIGTDDQNDLRSFINSPFDESNNDEFIIKYSLNGWLERFC